MATPKIVKDLVLVAKTARSAARFVRRIPTAGGQSGNVVAIDLVQTELSLVRAGLAE